MRRGLSAPALRVRGGLLAPALRGGGLCATLFVLGLLSAPASLAGAQARVVAFPTHSAEAAVSAAVDRELRVALQAREGVELAPAPALDLDAMQLAIDCVATSAECLREVAKRSNGEIVIAPSIIAPAPRGGASGERRGERAELRILFFSVKEGESRFAARRAAGKRIDDATLAAIPAMLDELFGASPSEDVAAPLPPPEAQSEPADAVPTSPVDSAGPSSGGRAVPVAPLIVTGTGVILLGAGAVMGAVMADTQHDYEKQPVTTMAEAEKAEALRDRGKSQALIANVLFGVGGAAVAAGGVWLVLALTDSSGPPSTALVPELGPDRAGLRIAGTWGGL